MKNSLARNTSYNIIYRILNVIFPLISATYISRILGPEGNGRVAYAQSIVSCFVLFAALGIPQYGTREIAKCKGDTKAVNRLFSELVTINAVATLACAVAYFLCVQFVFSGERLLYAVLGLELLFNFLNIDWLYYGKEDYAYITGRSILIKLLSLLMLFVFVKKPEDYITYGFIVCAGNCCNYIFNVVHARKYVRFVFEGLRFKQHIKPILLLLVSSVMAGLYNRVDTVMLGWLSSDAAVGYYTNANKIISIVLTLTTAVSAAFLPRLSYTYKKDQAAFHRYLKVGMQAVCVLVLPGAVGLALVAGNLAPTLFGDLYRPVSATIQILSASIVIRGLGDLLCYQTVISTGKENLLVKSRVIAGIVSVCLNYILIPVWGHNGTAMALVFSELIVNGVMLYSVRKIISVRLSGRFVGSTILGTCVMAGIVMVLQGAMSQGWFSLLVTVAAGIMAYTLVIFMLKNDMAMEIVGMLRSRLGREKSFQQKEDKEGTDGT